MRWQGARTQDQQRRKPTTNIDDWANLEWRRRWLQAARDSEAITWQTPWKQDLLELYLDLPKHQATALFLLRTEVIGLNAWLASIRVPDISPECECGWQEQNVQHVLLLCPKYSSTRSELISRAGCEDLRKMLSQPESAQAAARWLVQQATGNTETVRLSKADGRGGYIRSHSISASGRY